MTKLGLLFPGQGAQRVGMGKDFYDAFSIAKETFAHADDLLHTNLTKLIFEGPSEELSLTKNCQIAIYVTSCALWNVIKQEFGDITPFACAGLSLGEYTALTAAHVLPFEEGMKLVKMRGELMHSSSVKNPGSMSVVLGMTEEAVEKEIAPLRPKQHVWIANLNCPGQVVISGSKEGLEAAAGVLKTAGAKRVLPLDVSGAFHSEFMAEAKEFLKEAIEATSFSDPACKVVMNVPGDFVESTGDIQENLVKQVVAPVYWEKGIHKLEESGVTTYLEVGPGKTLAGMNKRIGVAGSTISVETVKDLKALEGIHAASK